MLTSRILLFAGALFFANSITAQTCISNHKIVLQNIPSCDTCSDGQAYLGSSGGSSVHSLVWTNSQGTVVGNSAFVQNVIPGLYFIEYRNDSGCVFRDSILMETAVDMFSGKCEFEPEFKYVVDICGHGVNFASIFIVDSIWNEGYTFFNLDRNQRIFGSPPTAEAPGNIHIGVIDKNGCVFSDTLEIPKMFTLTYDITLPSCSTCKDGSIDPTLILALEDPPNQNHSYIWTDLSTGQDLGIDEVLQNIGVGSYSLRIAGAHGGCSTLDTVVVAFPDGINEYGLPQLKVVPNPTSGVFTIDADQVEVYNISGEMILVSANRVIDLSDRDKGLYLIRAIRNEKVYAARVLVE